MGREAKQEREIVGSQRGVPIYKDCDCALCRAWRGLPPTTDAVLVAKREAK